MLYPSDDNHSNQPLQDKVRTLQKKQKKDHDRKAYHRTPVVVGDAVLVRQPDSRGKEIWRTAAIVLILEVQYYKISFADSRMRRKVHMNQLLHQPESK